MHILHVVASVGWGGMERCVVEVSNELAERHDVTVLLPPGAEYEGRFSDQVTRRPLPGGSRRNPLTIWRLAARIRELGPDIVHAHATKAAELVWWASRLPGGLGGTPYLATKQNTRRSRIFDLVPHVTAVSEAVARTLPDPRRAHVVYNGVRVRDVAPQPTSDVFTMVSITRLDPYKRVDVLIRAMAELDFPARLLIAGEGSERHALERLIREMGVEDRVEILGHREDVPELLAGAHMQVAASTREGFSLGVVEGLQYANVVLTTPVGGAREILSERFLVEPEEESDVAEVSASSRRAAEHVAVSPRTFASAMKRAYDDYDDYAREFVALRERHGERFTWQAVAEAYVAVYRSILDGAASRDS